MTAEQERAICLTCKWWTGEVTRHVKYDGHCKVNPPAAGSPRWPVTDAYEWCGQHTYARREALG